LSALRTLDLHGSALEKLPASIGALRSLESLDLGGNALGQLPPSLGRLTSLKELSLEGNRLAALPEEMGGLAQLKGLNIAGNDLAHVPGSLENLAHLAHVRLDGNPLLDVPPGLRKYTAKGLPAPGASQGTIKEALNPETFRQRIHALELPPVAGAGEGLALPRNPQPRLGPDGGNPMSPLPNLPVTAIGAGNLLNLDSVRNAWLSVEKLRLKETPRSGIRKDVLLKEKQSLAARTFFDGVVGINNRAEFVTFSPAAGIGITRRIAAGLGPMVGLNSKNTDQHLAWGYRSFARYELLPRKLNLQVEDIGDVSRFPTRVLRETGGKRLTHTFYAGVGYLFNYSKYKSITINTLYQLNRVRQSPSLYSPFLFRIGFSAFHHKHKQL
jgi:hypothetical protein